MVQNIGRVGEPLDTKRTSERHTATEGNGNFCIPNNTDEITFFKTFIPSLVEKQVFLLVMNI